MEKNKPILSYRNVSLNYGRREILRDFSLDVNPGEILVILGLIGVGKTRILRLAAGLEKVHGGEVHYDHPGRVSYVFQDDLLIPWLTVARNLELCRRGSAAGIDVVREFNLDSMMSLKPRQLSGGMRKTVNVARGFLNDDPLLLMDEPFNGLDPLQKRDLLSTFLRLQAASGRTVLFVTHDVRDAFFVADRIALLSSKQKTIESIFENPLKGHYEDEALFTAEAFRLNKTVMDFYEKDRA